MKSEPVYVQPFHRESFYVTGTLLSRLSFTMIVNLKLVRMRVDNPIDISFLVFQIINLWICHAKKRMVHSSCS